MEKLTVVFLPLIWLAGWIYALLPEMGREISASLIGALLHLAQFRAGVVRQNLQYAYPHEPNTRERVERESYRAFARLMLEILMLPAWGPLPGAMRFYVKRRSQLLGKAHWAAARDQGHGVIFVSSHVGNWEIMAATGAIHGGMDLMIVTKRLKPAWLHRAIERGREHCGVRCAYEPQTLRDTLGHLRRGGTVGFVLDQYAGPPIGVRVPVFGIPVGTLSAPAALAKRTGAPLLPVLNFRQPNGSAGVIIREPIRWQEGVTNEEDVAKNTAHLAQLMEADIRAYPGQWLWTHRRFKGDLSPLRPGEWALGRTRK